MQKQHQSFVLILLFIWSFISRLKVGEFSHCNFKAYVLFVFSCCWSLNSFLIKTLFWMCFIDLCSSHVLSETRWSALILPWSSLKGCCAFLLVNNVDISLYICLIFVKHTFKLCIFEVILCPFSWYSLPLIWNITNKSFTIKTFVCADLWNWNKPALIHNQTFLSYLCSFFSVSSNCAHFLFWLNQHVVYKTWPVVWCESNTSCFCFHSLGHSLMTEY